MSAVWLMTPTFLCLFIASLAAADKYEVVWKKVGNSITIQCKDSSDQKYLHVKRGLDKSSVLFTSEKNPSKIIICPNMTSRIQTHGTFPNVEILIKNLSVEDTGPYWCFYSTFEDSEDNKGQGSLLLVVTENKNPAVRSVQSCESPPMNLVVVYVIGAAMVLLLLILAFVMWIIRRNSRPSVKPRRVATNNNDVYEDMRGTLRR